MMAHECVRQRLWRRRRRFGFHQLVCIESGRLCVHALMAGVRLRARTRNGTEKHKHHTHAVSARFSRPRHASSVEVPPEMLAGRTNGRNINYICAGTQLPAEARFVYTSRIMKF